jgi:hypothetical protein
MKTRSGNRQHVRYLPKADRVGSCRMQVSYMGVVSAHGNPTVPAQVILLFLAAAGLAEQHDSARQRPDLHIENIGEPGRGLIDPIQPKGRVHG